MRYPGPLRREPLAVELHNTLYAVGGTPADGLADAGAARAWLAGLSDRLPAGGTGAGPSREELTELRDAVVQALQAAVARKPPSRASLDAINRASARAPSAPTARWRRAGQPLRETAFGRATRADVVVSALAADAIALLTGPAHARLRACEAPGCVLLFLKDHPRREWCSATCGNRARQARHYRRTREHHGDS